MTTTHDGPRAAGVLFRMSRADREALKERAADAGCDTIQQYLELVALGRRTEPLPSGRPRNPQRERLPLSG